VRNKILLVSGTIAVLAFASCIVATPVLSRVIKARTIFGLEQNFACTLEVNSLNVSIFPRMTIVGRGIVFRLKGRPERLPLFIIRTFTATANPLGLLAGHVSSVRLEGLDIHIPPRDDGAQQGKAREESETTAPRFVVDEIIADGATLTTTPRDSWKVPLTFDIRFLRLYGGGPADAMKFAAELRNAKPPGDIKSSGTFGPWNRDEPGGTPVSGKYTFRDADLAVFKGIAGRLSSDGNYQGSLGHIEAEGVTDVPDFRLLIAGNPVHLTAQYKAVIDGTDGDTYLQHVTGQFGRTSLTAQGSVESKQGERGKTVSLDVVVHSGRLEDLLLLAMKGRPMMRGAVQFQTKLVVPPGDVDVAQKVGLDGTFAMDSAR
jgi:hypothetical protein